MNPLAPLTVLILSCAVFAVALNRWQPGRDDVGNGRWLMAAIVATIGIVGSGMTLLAGLAW